MNMEAHITEEGIWELPPLEDIIAKGEHIWTRNSFTPAKSGQRREQAAQAYALYQRVIELWRQKMPYHFIGKEVGKRGTVIRCWIEKHQLPNALAEIVYKKKDRRVIPETADESMLRVIALILGTTRYHGRYKQRWSYEKTDPKDPVLEYARRTLTAAFGEGSFHDHVKQTTQKKDTFYPVIFQSVAFFEQYNAATKNGTRLPWEHMLTLEAKLAVAEAFCQVSLTTNHESHRDEHGRPATAGLVITKKNTPEGISLLEQVAVLLNDLGSYPFVSVSGNLSTLQVTDPDDVKYLLAMGCVPAACVPTAELIASGANRRHRRGQHIVLQAYRAAQALPKGLTPEVISQKQEIAARYGVSMSLVSEWYRGDSTPRIVQRDNILRNLRKKYADMQVQAPVQETPLHAADEKVLAFLETKPENPVNEYLAQRYTSDGIALYAFAFERARVEKSDWPRWLMLPEEVLCGRLDRTAPIMVTSNGTTYQFSWQALRDYCGIEGFQPYGAPSDEWRSHLRRIRDCLPRQLRPGQTTHQHDGLTFTLAHAKDKVVVTDIR